MPILLLGLAVMLVPIAIASVTLFTQEDQMDAFERAAVRAGCRFSEELDAPPSHVGGAALRRLAAELPTVGGHYPRVAPWGSYREPVPDGYLVHSLEHGGIVIQYRPSLGTAGIRELERLGGEPPGQIVVAPRPGEAGITATAWRRRLRCAGLGPFAFEAIRAFRDAFGNRDAGHGLETAPAGDFPTLPRPLSG